jgi:hypothetical protein
MGSWGVFYRIVHGGERGGKRNGDQRDKDMIRDGGRLVFGNYFKWGLIDVVAIRYVVRNNFWRVYA